MTQEEALEKLSAAILEYLVNTAEEPMDGAVLNSFVLKATASTIEGLSDNTIRTTWTYPKGQSPHITIGLIESLRLDAHDHYRESFVNPAG